MKSSVLLLLLLSVNSLAITMRQFRAKDVIVNIGDYKYSTVAGTLIHQASDDSRSSRILFLGMIMDIFTPIAFVTDTKYSKNIGEFEMEYECGGVMIGRNESYLESTMILRGTWDKAEFIGNCRFFDGTPFTFKGIGNKSQSLLYDPKEAGLRAKMFIDKDTKDFQSYEIIGLAIIDSYYEFKRCSHFLDPVFPDLPGPSPGAIIVGRDGQHCAIVDNEGGKFIHGNPVSRKVTLESITTISRYFPRGVYYKGYPDYSKTSLNSFVNLSDLVD